MNANSDDLLYALTQAAKSVDPEPGRTGTWPSYEEIAKRQAVEMEKRRLVNVALRRERDEALGDRRAALRLAAQYAARAGVDPADDDQLRWVAEEQQQRAGLERDWWELENVRFENAGLARDLHELASGQRVFGGSVAELAAVIADELIRINNAQGGKRRTLDLFALPAVPDGALFPEPAPEPRRLAPVPARDAVRPVDDAVVVGGRL